VAFPGLGERVWHGSRDAARGGGGGESWNFRL
jgi:hypothetical protein